MSLLPDLFSAAQRAMENAHAPYSGFTVGAALAAEDGSIWIGSNVEIASFGGTICAERSALVAAVSHGYRKFSHILITSSSDSPIAPCGICRQTLLEFAPDLKVLSYTETGLQKSWSLQELLPDSFGPKNLTSK